MISVGWRRGTSRNRYSKASCKRRFLVVLTVAAVVTAGLATTPATQPANAATTLGGILNGASNGDDYGHDTALSADGTRLVVGVPGDDTVASDAGLVRVFDWDGASWNQIGPDLTLGDPDDRFGYAVDITRDGTSVIVGAPGAIGGLGGSVAVYRIDGSTWTQVGSTIDGIWEFGSEVAISDDGNRIAASNLEDEVDAFRFTDGFWPQLGTTIGGGAPPGKSRLEGAFSLSATRIGTRTGSSNSTSGRGRPGTMLRRSTAGLVLALRLRWRRAAGTWSSGTPKPTAAMARSSFTGRRGGILGNNSELPLQARPVRGSARPLPSQATAPASQLAPQAPTTVRAAHGSLNGQATATTTPHWSGSTSTTPSLARWPANGKERQ